MSNNLAPTQADQKSFEQVFLLFRDQLFCYAHSLSGDDALSKQMVVHVFAKYYRFFLAQHSLYSSKLDLYQLVWNSFTRIKGRTRLDKQIYERSITALFERGLTKEEIASVMGIRHRMIDDFYGRLESSRTTSNSHELSSCITIDRIWEQITAIKKRRQKFIYISCLLVIISLFSLGGYLYRQAHIPAQRSQISLSHPLHLNPIGTIIHTKQWNGSATWENWQNTKTGQMKTIFENKGLKEVTYWTNDVRYYFVYQDGILRKEAQSKAPLPASLLQKADITQFGKPTEISFHGLTVNEYKFNQLVIFVDKKTQLILMTKQLTEDPNISTTPHYYGYEYLQSVGSNFFDLPSTKKN